MDNSCVGYFNEKGIWYKYDVPEKVFKSLGMTLDWGKLIEESNKEYGFNPTCFQLLNFAMMFKMKRFNKLPTSLFFKKEKLVDKDGLTTHYKFSLRGTDKVMLIFNQLGRLTELKTPLTPNVTIKYEYGGYNLVLPVTNKILVTQSDVNMLTNFYKKLMIQ